MRIALIRRNGFGDLLCSMPLCRRLKQIYPESEVTLFVEERNAPLTPYLKHYVDNVEVTPHYKPLGVLYALYQRRKKWDLAISGKTSPMKYMNYLLWGLGARDSRAYCDGHWTSRLVNGRQDYIKAQQKGLHQAALALRLIDSELIRVPEELHPRLVIPTEVIANHLPTITQQLSFGNPDDPLLLLSVSNNRPGSCTLPLERWARLINLTSERRPFRVILSCVPKDAAIAVELGKQLRVPNRALPTQSFDQFMVLLSQMNTCFLGEGGTMHLAAGLGIPQIALFGKTCPVQWAPLSTKATCFSDPLSIIHLSDELLVDAVDRTIGTQIER